MHVLDRCNKVGYSQQKNMRCMQGEANATFLGLVAILDVVTTKLKRCYYYSLPLQQILVMAIWQHKIQLLQMEAQMLRRIPGCWEWKLGYCDANQRHCNVVIVLQRFNGCCSEAKRYGNELKGRCSMDQIQKQNKESLQQAQDIATTKGIGPTQNPDEATYIPTTRAAARPHYKKFVFL